MLKKINYFVYSVQESDAHMNYLLTKKCLRFCTLTAASFHSDEHYDSFYPQYHQPLHVLLGKPLYLEVRLLNPPDPTAMLLVHYCVAYPRSAQSAWILIYDGYKGELSSSFPLENNLSIELSICLSNRLII